MLAKELTYYDFALDEVLYLVRAYEAGLRYNAMVSQAQRVCECYLKHLINRSLMNNNEVMRSHNLRALYDYCMSMGIDLTEIRADVMLLNNFYNHTRYPGRDAFMASDIDVETAVQAIIRIHSFIARCL